MTMENGIQQVSPSSTALNAERYQSFEMAKANDDILGGENITAIRGYAARVRAEAQVIHKSLSMMSDYDDAVAAKSEIFESEQTLAKVGIYADQRIGEILRELPKSNKWASNSDTQEVETKADAIKESGISKSQAYDLQAMAANPEVVEAVIAKATEEGRVPSRKQVLDAIDEKKRAERERRLAEQEADRAKRDLADAYRDAENLEAEIASLKRQVAEKPKPEVIEREVVREVESESSKRRIVELERIASVRADDNRRLREQLENKSKELDKAKDVLNMDKTMTDLRTDVQFLITSTNQYIRRYGGLSWTVQELGMVDESLRTQLKDAAINLATFANALVVQLEEM